MNARFVSPSKAGASIVHSVEMNGHCRFVDTENVRELACTRQGDGLVAVDVTASNTSSLLSWPVGVTVIVGRQWRCGGVDDGLALAVSDVRLAGDAQSDDVIVTFVGRPVSALEDCVRSARVRFSHAPHVDDLPADDGAAVAEKKRESYVSIDEFFGFDGGINYSNKTKKAVRKLTMGGGDGVLRVECANCYLKYKVGIDIEVAGSMTASGWEWSSRRLVLTGTLEAAVDALVTLSPAALSGRGDVNGYMFRKNLIELLGTPHAGGSPLYDPGAIKIQIPVLRPWGVPVLDLVLSLDVAFMARVTGSPSHLALRVQSRATLDRSWGWRGADDGKFSVDQLPSLRDLLRPSVTLSGGGHVAVRAGAGPVLRLSVWLIGHEWLMRYIPGWSGLIPVNNFHLVLEAGVRTLGAEGGFELQLYGEPVGKKKRKKPPSYRPEESVRAVPEAAVSIWWWQEVAAEGAEAARAAEAAQDRSASTAGAAALGERYVLWEKSYYDYAVTLVRGTCEEHDNCTIVLPPTDVTPLPPPPPPHECEAYGSGYAGVGCERCVQALGGGGQCAFCAADGRCGPVSFWGGSASFGGAGGQCAASAVRGVGGRACAAQLALRRVPAAGAVVAAGSTVSLAFDVAGWSAAAASSALVRVSLRASSEHTYVHGVDVAASSGTVNYTLPAALPNGDGYQLRLTLLDAADSSVVLPAAAIAETPPFKVRSVACDSQRGVCVTAAQCAAIGGADLGAGAASGWFGRGDCDDHASTLCCSSPRDLSRGQLLVEDFPACPSCGTGASALSLTRRAFCAQPRGVLAKHGENGAYGVPSASRCASSADIPPLTASCAGKVPACPYTPLSAVSVSGGSEGGERMFAVGDNVAVQWAGGRADAPTQLWAIIEDGNSCQWRHMATANEYTATPGLLVWQVPSFGRLVGDAYQGGHWVPLMMRTQAAGGAWSEAVAPSRVYVARPARWTVDASALPLNSSEADTQLLSVEVVGTRAVLQLDVPLETRGSATHTFSSVYVGDVIGVVVRARPGARASGRVTVERSAGAKDDFAATLRWSLSVPAASEEYAAQCSRDGGRCSRTSTSDALRAQHEKRVRDDLVAACQFGMTSDDARQLIGRSRARSYEALGYRDDAGISDGAAGSSTAVLIGGIAAGVAALLVAVTCVVVLLCVARRGRRRATDATGLRSRSASGAATEAVAGYGVSSASNSKRSRANSRTDSVRLGASSRRHSRRGTSRSRRHTASEGAVAAAVGGGAAAGYESFNTRFIHSAWR